MADDALVKLIVEAGVDAWNRSRVSHPNYPQCDIYEEALWGADLSGANLSDLYLDSAIFLGADLRNATLRGAKLSRAWLHQADLSGADCEGAQLNESILADTKLRYANLHGASLLGARIEGDKRFTYPSHIVVGADLTGARLTEADLTSAQISNSSLAGANLTGANVADCKMVDVEVYGASIWGLKGNPARQTGITAKGLQFDDLRVAVFADLLLNGHLNLGSIIEIGAKTNVLLLGRFGEERKKILEALREKLASLGFSPMVCDFAIPQNRDISETIIVLAGISLFVIADLTNPRSVPLELQATVPNFMIPFAPIIQKGEEPFAMFRDLLGKYDWVLDPLEYDQLDKLLLALEPAIIAPALKKREELRQRKVDVRPTRSIDDYL